MNLSSEKQKLLGEIVDFETKNKLISENICELDKILLKSQTVISHYSVQN